MEIPGFLGAFMSFHMSRQDYLSLTLLPGTSKNTNHSAEIN